MKKSGLLKSLSICLVVAVLMVGAGFFLLAGESPATQTGSKVEAAWDGLSLKEKDDSDKTSDQERMIAAYEQRDEANEGKDEKSLNDKDPEPAVVKAASTQVEEVKEVEESTKQDESNEPKEKSQPVEAATEEPAAVPVPVEEEPKEEEIKAELKPEVQSVSTAAPVTYTWGSAGNYTFRMEVAVTNNGSSTSNNVTVAVPLLENRSPYQETSLKSVNYNIVSTSGRVSTFSLGDLAPGETKTIRADFDIRVRPVAISSTNETVEKARQAYEMYAGSGNCRTLARAFINKSQEMGINAREVIGFARPQRGAMTSGSLAGTRHSWAEFEVPGVGWFPVDLTFQYFGELPHTSHIVESYSDQSIKVNYSGGSLSATWSNLIL